MWLQRLDVDSAKRRRTLIAGGADAGFDAPYVGVAIQEAACLGALRRKLYNLHAARPSPLITEALRRIAELYVIEAAIRGAPPDERLCARRAQARPLLEDRERWLHASLDKLSCKSDTAGAIQYTLNLWPSPISN